MYVNYLNNRKALEYKAVKDTNCGIELVVITESTVLLIRNLPSKVKDKTKKVIIVSCLGVGLWFSNLEPVEAIGLSIMPSTPVVRAYPSYQHDSKVKTAKVITRKKDLIADISNRKILFLMYLTDPRLSSNQEILKFTKELRGGDLSFVVGLGLIGLILLILASSVSEVESFIPGWGLNNLPFQPPTAEHRYPPYYDLFFPKGTCYADRPGGSQIMAGVNPQFSREELTQLSTDVVPTQSQISGFVKNGKVDLNQAFNEVNRRASAIDCETFECSFERFKELATECGIIQESSVREAITILQGEMHGYYENARRVDYGLNVKGPDFAVDGLGEFENITHAEAKNTVGSAIEKADGFIPNIWKQGKKVGKKSIWQKNFWSNSSQISEIPNLNFDAYLPKSINNMLTVVDCYDVPNFEKQRMNSAISFGAKNDTNLIILNNFTNI